MTDYKICLRAGIGDTLNLLGYNNSIDKYCKINNAKIYWTYDLKFENCGWTVTLKELFKYCPYMEYIDYYEFKNHKATELYNHLEADKSLLRNLYGDENKGGISLILPLEEENQINQFFEEGIITIGFQLSSADGTKQYSTENFVKLFKLILDKFENVKILAIESPLYHPPKELFFDDRIINLVGKISFAQCFTIIQKTDYWISSDSYSKYIRNWVDKPQTVLCTFLTWFTNDNTCSVFNWAFVNPGLANNPKVTILGVEYTPDFKNVIWGASVNNISPEEIFKSIDLSK
jgi:hypothetical protein